MSERESKNENQPTILTTAIVVIAFISTVALTLLNWRMYGGASTNLALIVVVALTTAFIIPVVMAVVSRSRRWLARIVNVDTARFYGLSILVCGTLICIVSRLALAPVLFDHQPDSKVYQKVALDSVNNILDNLFACAIFAGFALIFGNKLYAWYTNDKRVLTKHFSSLDDCLLHLAQAAELFERKPEDAYVVLVSPLVFTESYIQYALAGQPETTKHRCLASFNAFRLIYNRIVQTGRGAYDKTLVGRTDIHDLDIATLASLKDSHRLDRDEVPGTTELGFHENLNEYMTFIVGRCQPHDPASPKEYVFMLQIYFSHDFKIMSGFIYYDQSVIRDTEFVLAKKWEETPHRITNRAPEDRKLGDWPEFKQGLTKFLQG